jgi:thioredoxin 1
MVIRLKERRKNASEPGQSIPIEAGAANFESEVLKSKLPVLVAFWAAWSHPCQILCTVLGEVAIACAGSIKVVRVNADDNPDLSLWYEIQSVPTMLYFVGGSLRAKMVGTASHEAILAKWQSILHGGSSPPPKPGINP